ncbi:MAG: DUF202 domain-containing protein [Actinomycetes bacterium]
MSPKAHDPEGGLAGERTDLAWSRTGLAMIVIIASIGRRALTIRGTTEIVSLFVVLIGTLVWAFGLRGAHRISRSTATGRHTTELHLLTAVTIGSITIALAALLISI